MLKPQVRYVQVSKLASVEEAQKVKEKEERNHLGMDAMLASLQVKTT